MTKAELIEQVQAMTEGGSGANKAHLRAGLAFQGDFDRGDSQAGWGSGNDA
jgi:hypothetical protein